MLNNELLTETKSRQLKIHYFFIIPLEMTDSLAGEYAIQILSTIGRKLYLNDDYADFHFIFAQGERIPAHKLILANVSDVFQVMFNGSWKEKVDVEIVDATADAFKAFLQFFYLPKATVTMDNVAEVMNLGKKYDVTECFDVCGNFLKENLIDDNIYEAYELAIHLEHKELEKRCENYIEMNAKAIFTLESFLKCDRKTVKRILQMDSLNCSEARVFDTLINWMKAKSKLKELTTDVIRKEFSDLVREIRFGSMNLREFISFDRKFDGLFTFDEHKEIIQMIDSDEFQPEIFKKNRRINEIQWNENAIIECDRYNGVSNVIYYIKNIETTTFSVNKTVLLGAFSRDSRLQSDITIFEILNSNRRVVLYSGNSGADSIYSMRIVLPKPILIRTGFLYQIQLTQSPPENCCNDGKFKTLVRIGSDLTVQFYDDPIINNEARGLLFHLELNRVERD